MTPWILTVNVHRRSIPKVLPIQTSTNATIWHVMPWTSWDITNVAIATNTASKRYLSPRLPLEVIITILGTLLVLILVKWLRKGSHLILSINVLNAFDFTDLLFAGVQDSGAWLGLVQDRLLLGLLQPHHRVVRLVKRQFLDGHGLLVVANQLLFEHDQLFLRICKLLGIISPHRFIDTAANLDLAGRRVRRHVWDVIQSWSYSCILLISAFALEIQTGVAAVLVVQLLNSCIARMADANDIQLIDIMFLVWLLLYFLVPRISGITSFYKCWNRLSPSFQGTLGLWKRVTRTRLALRLLLWCLVNAAYVLMIIGYVLVGFQFLELLAIFGFLLIFLKMAVFAILGPLFCKFETFRRWLP